VVASPSQQQQQDGGAPFGAQFGTSPDADRAVRGGRGLY
jgi:hypothetical protein